MEVRSLQSSDRENYNRFVSNHPSGSFLQSWEWGQWQAFLGRPIFRYAVFDDASIMGTIQVIQTMVPGLTQAHYLYAPHGPLLNIDNKLAVCQALLEQLRHDFPKAWFIRLEPKGEIPQLGRPTLRIQPGKTSLLDVTINDDAMLQRMHSKTRYSIRLAIRHDVEVTTTLLDQNITESIIDESAELLEQTAKRQSYRSHGADYYRKLFSFYRAHAKPDGSTITIYQARYQGQLLAMAAMMDYGATRTYLFGGSNEEHRAVMPTYALHWRAIRDARNLGLTTYDWWGIETAGGAMPGFVRFKINWGGEAHSYPVPQDIIQKPLWYTVYNVIRKLSRSVS
jgi:peptidoglycan pentaglycine glycine transferase (the first glycine)